MMKGQHEGKEQTEELPLSKAAEFLLNECRMVLPGIQALFGFQLIAVFNPGFSKMLEPYERQLHLLAIVLVVVAIALIMTPAAYHRQTTPQEVTQAFIRLSTRLVLWSMLPLCAGICIDAYLVTRIILDDVLVPLLLTMALFLVFVTLWFLLPRVTALKRCTGGS
jgi:hypothetical protein